MTPAERVAHLAQAFLAERQANAGPRDWPADFAHENGDYLNVCIACNQVFSGHKRRIECRLCERPRDAYLPTNAGMTQ